MNNFKYMLLRYRIIYFERSKSLSTWFDLPNRSDRRSLPKHTSAKLLCNNFGVPENEKVLFSRDTSPWDDSDQGLVLTDRRIYYTDSKKDVWCIDLDEVIDVYYNDKGGFVFVSDQKEEKVLSTNYFFYGSEGGKYYDQLACLIKELIYYPYMEMFDGKTISERAEFAKELLGFDLNYPIIHKSIADDYFAKGLNEEARKAYIAAFVYCTTNEDKRELYSCIQETECRMKRNGQWNSVIEKPYNQRKFLMVMSDNSFGKVDMKSSLVYCKNNIPSTISFPYGHPVDDTLYIANPSSSTTYIPQEQSEEILFLEKVNEYCDMLRGLGAIEICITFDKGLTLDAMESYTNNSKAETDLHFADCSMSENKSGNTQTKVDEQSSRKVKYVYDPIKKPFLQKGNWYELNENWKRIAQARLESNLLQYEEEFSTISNSQLDKSEKEIVDAAAKIKCLNVEGSIHEDSESTQKENRHTETKWTVSVRFRSLKEWK